MVEDAETLIYKNMDQTIKWGVPIWSNDKLWKFGYGVCNLEYAELAVFDYESCYLPCAWCGAVVVKIMYCKNIMFVL